VKCNKIQRTRDAVYETTLTTTANSVLAVCAYANRNCQHPLLDINADMLNSMHDSIFHRSNF